MKKLVLSLPLAIAMSLTGCSGDDTTLQEVQNSAQQDNQTVTPIARIVFDPTGGKLSVPNDLLFSGTTDGTLEMPDEVAARAANGYADYTDPGQALGVLDGWSTQNPWVLGIDFPTGYSLDADSAGMPGAVRLFEVKMGGEAGCETVPRGVACAPVAELTFGVDFVTSASGNSVAVAPLKPLKASTTYIMATTDMLKDNAGRSIGASSTYELVKQNINTHPLVTPSQLALQGVVNSFEGVLGALGVDPETITYTAAMTTQSVGDVIFTVKTMMAANMQLNPAATPAVVAQNTGATVADLLVGAGQLSTDHPLYMAFASAQYYAGQVTVPYYLSVPSAENPLAPVNTPWKAACDSGVKVQGYAQAVGDSFPYPADTAPMSANDAMCMALSGGQLRDFTNPETGEGALDTDRHMTKYNLIPRLNAMQTLDVQMSIPNLDMVNLIRQSMGLPALEMPAMGFPVVILQHGVGSRKEDMLAAVGSLNVAGFATVAIDLPLHSSRGFDVNGDGTDDINASTVSPTHYFNLANLPVTRDNVRQGTSDLMALRLGLNFTQGAPINPTQVHYMGLSLGGIVGTNFLAITNTPNLQDALGAPVDGLFKISSSVLASPGGGLANLLVESPAFGPLVQGSILAAAGTPLSNEFNAFLGAGVPECIQYLESQDAYLNCAFQIFGLGLTQTGQTAKIDEIKGLVGQFVFAAQTVTDAGDPSNLAHFAKNNGTPILLTEIVGDGMENLNDQVVPNQTVNTSIGGTEPLIRGLGLAPITDSMVGEVVDGVPSQFSGVIRFTKGHHASLLSPAANSAATDAVANARVTAEMQNQAVSYFLSDGTAILISDGEFVQGHE